MRHGMLAALTIGAFALMIGLNALSRNEVLPVEDGKSAATTLPLDEATSRTAFQTATFGLG